MELWQQVLLISGTAILAALFVIGLFFLVELLGELFDEWADNRTLRRQELLQARAERLRQTMREIDEELASAKQRASRELEQAMYLTITPPGSTLK